MLLEHGNGRDEEDIGKMVIFINLTYGLFEVETQRPNNTHYHTMKWVPHF